MSNEPSSVPGATPNTDPPATGPASTGATPEQKPTLTLEEALKRIADLEHSQKNATEEVDRHRKKLSHYEKAEREAEAAKKAAEEAQLSEIEKTNKRATESETRAEQYRQRLVTAEVKFAAKSAGIIDPELAVLAVQNDLEYGEDGMPTNVEEVLEKLVKNKPYLAPKQEAQPPAESPARGTPTIPAMNPGRSQIAAPGSTPPGRIPRLSDPGVLVPPGTVSKYQP